jgi:hypothetical protein
MLHAHTETYIFMTVPYFVHAHMKRLVSRIDKRAIYIYKKVLESKIHSGAHPSEIFCSAPVILR